MRKLRFVILLCSMAKMSFGQQLHFVYIQTDNHNPFYARIGDKILSSEADGYLVISRLRDSTYELILGFPKNPGPEWSFNCKINKKDVGYVFKDFGEKGWGLFNLQSMEVIMGNKVETKTKTAEHKSGSSGATVSNDPFSVLLAAAVSDSSIRQTPIVIIDKVPVAPPVTVGADLAKTKSNVDSTSVASSNSKKVDEKKNSAKNEDSALMKSVAVSQADPGSKKAGQAIDESVASKSAATKPDVNNIIAPVVLTRNDEKKPETKSVSTVSGVDSTATKSQAKNSEEKKPVQSKPDSTATALAITEKKSNPIKPDSNAIAQTSVDKTSAKSVAESDSKKKNDIKADKPLDLNEKTAALVVAPIPANSEKKETEKTNRKNKGADSTNIVSKNPVGQKIVASTVIKKMLERHGNEGTEMIYIDENGGGKPDTVRILIPAEKALTNATSAAIATSTNAKFLDMAVSPKQESKTENSSVKKEEKKNVFSLSDSGNALSVPETSGQQSKVSAAVNANCKVIAGTEDLEQVRKKMISKVDEDDMIAVALKAFKSKCYTTDQVKNLSYVFLKDPGKYKLFDTAFPYVSDPGNYSELESQLSDTYYINRFKTLVQK